MEPNSARYDERLNALKALHDKGCRTWVSVEPFPTPNLVDQKLDNLLDTIAFTDKIIFGRTNYSKEVTAYTGQKEFYNKCAKLVIRFCDDHGIDYHIKDGTLTEDTKSE